MPSFVITCRGGLLLKAGLQPTGSLVEMSEKDAASLPSGTVAPAPVAPVAPVVPVVTVAAKSAPKPSHVAVKAKDSKP